MSTDTQDERLVAANKLIKFISECGKRIFREPESGRVAFLELDSGGVVWFVDAWTDESINTHHEGTWKGFSEEDTLRTLIEGLRDFITGGEQLKKRTFRTWPDRRSGDDPWGYGPDMEQVKAEARALGVKK